MGKAYLNVLLIGIASLYSMTVNAAELAEIKERGELIIGVKDNLRPLGFRGETGELQGFEIEIAKHLAAEILGDETAIVLKPVTNQERLAVVYEDKVDLTIARVGITAARSRLVDFSPYYYLDYTGIVTKDPNIQGHAALANRKIAVLRGSSTVAILKYELPDTQLVGVNSYQEALDYLETGQADAFAADQSVLTGWVQDYPQYRRLEVKYAGTALGIVMPKGLQYVSLRQAVTGAIAQWRTSGWLQQRVQFWGLP
jgi:polar amino acid transport system substrate-binding protein